ncbi:septation protein IspZ [Haematobacter massiliensis]|uniref:Inner membrane-spanning protein YciB n=1 Tax=Haematobacter massiliensis TaxID=195105 RepID=A0A086YB79_9RHOB|nr:inner membrane-spanning protein YciB [Haematobacter massiliensis]KFI31529.1 Intracellular septation protein A [Haematobacter massiliensis]OWJ71579.1 septation protein IspZ [Haematobacter massiliensis]OWJ88017.1 septation protein IspZ [Haematobacter massiliensis]QBJ23602.1 septation protein IspZ [Haematobacter massiliensis]
MAVRKINPWLKLALELGPVLLFFVGYMRIKDQSFVIGGTSYDGFILMTAAFIPVMIACTAILWVLTGHLSRMQVLTLVLVTVFGGLSVWLNDERFFKMKLTIIYLLFAAVLGVGLLQGKSYLRFLMDEVVPMREEGWMILTRRIFVFFLLIAVANEVVWRTLSTEVWVNFKTFGLTLAVFAFFITQGKLFERYAVQKEKPGE